MSAGNYKISLVFEEPVSQLKIGGLLYPGETSNTGQTPANKEKPSLDYTSLTITKGFKDKVSVINTGGAKLTFTSSNNSIATVASNGVVTAKKKGKATITVTTSTGYKLSCKVKVVDNVYSKKKTALSKVKKGDFTVNVYKVSYDKKGNLILKTRLLNKCGSQVQYIKNFKIILKNGNGKKIGTYTVKKKNIKLKSGKKKDYTLKIKKSKLKLKQNQDLRFLGKPSVSGDYYIKPKYVPKKKPQSSGGSTKQTSQPAVRAKKTITVISAH
ncbi:MAG: Ig-like domain-containing protein [Lachnospiraceae bacterium]|nr:Ig-like domain-containing protein [Lachnospiraceae bacterium]